MAPAHLRKRQREPIESPKRIRRCTDDRKHTISDESIRSHCEESDNSASMLDLAFNALSSLSTRIVTTVSSLFSAPTPPSDSDWFSDQYSISSTDSSLPFQDFRRNRISSSPSPRKTNGYYTPATTSPTLSHSYSASSSRSPRRASSGARPNGVIKPYRRNHIRYQKHRDEVKEKLRQELFALKTSAGQPAAEVREYLLYVDKIDKIDAAGGVFAAVSKHVSQRHPFSPSTCSQKFEAERLEFLRKAIKRAKDSLDSARIPNNLPRYIDELKDLYKNSRLAPLPIALSPEDQAELAAALSKRGTVAKFAREQVSHSDIARLRPGQWLNDEVINFYGALIIARSEEAQKGKGKALDAHYFNTFFFAKLEDMGYEKSRIGKWTKKIDIFKKDIVLIPVNLGNAHWTCAAINFQKKRIEYHDSMGRKRGKIYKILRDYLNCEHRDKKKTLFDFTGWKDYFDDDAPQQENGYDCGVFSCQFMECLSRGAPFQFSQENMKYFRQRMILDIVRGKLWDYPSI